VNGSCPRQAGHGVQQRIGCAGRSAIDQKDAIGGGLRNDIGFPGKAQNEQIIAQSEDTSGFRRLLRAYPAAAQDWFANKNQSAANRGFQYLSTRFHRINWTEPDFPVL
jgi:hypothetical protein